ncbi:MAG: 5'-methylthioadenosine/S-adenosylhomocysteine nucleosidase [Chitinophagaceae bacterium]|nr:5'-methylthioadenosine/S-adenosylhomocysteine nucleosidase [Chitinophagaceae bacterium]
MKSIVILTALPLEQDAIVSKLSGVDIYEHPESRTQYKIGYCLSKGSRLKIVVGRSNQTNVNAAIETERMIQHFDPSHILFVGVAGGLKDVTIGDIVIGADVYGYERAKVTNEFLSRPKFAFSSYDLEMKAVDFSNSLEWKTKSVSIANQKFQKQVEVFSGTIASGEKVIASTESDLFKFIKSHISHALAVEMEGLGFLEACRHYPSIKSLIIRGISDLVDGKNIADKDGSQQYAANNAAEFLFGLLDYLDLNQEMKPPSMRQKLFEIVTKLYPEGLKDKGLWLRAGGDLSVVHLNTTGKAQWIEALRLIENGGGGDIDFETLIREMKIDYPKNESWKLM